MSRKCSFCGNTDFRAAEVQYVYRHNGSMLIVNGVPCEECTYCGERYYEADVLKKIEREFEAIRSGKRRPQRKLTVPIDDYSRLVG